jgi:dimethylglycine dehydrogenase
MSDFPKTARVVIIGGGAVGVSCLYHLAIAGWTDCVLLEKNELTAGSTWHAAGNVPTFSSSWAIMNMQRYSTELYRNLSKKVDYPMNYHVTGSVRLAHTLERMQEFERAKGMGLHQGMNLDVVSVDDLKARYPFLETHGLSGGLFDPYDGDIDPSQLTQALAKGSRKLGAQIIRFCPATGIERKNQEWIVKTGKGDIFCDYVVNSAGYYAQAVAEWFKPFGGRTLPMMVMSHQYLLTEEIKELEDWSANSGRKLPLLRDVDSSYYLRQEKNGLNLGPYEGNCRAHWVEKNDPMPDDFSFQLYPDDLERLEWHIEDAMARVPILGQAGISKVINGPIPYTPDGNPLIGPMPGVPNAFEACVFTFGIAQGGGAGKVLSEWITKGYTEWDMWSCDPRRFTDFCDHDYCVAKGMEVYGHEYAMHFPYHSWPAGRNKKLSPSHEKVLELGGQMGSYNGWERANWFAKKGDNISEQATQTWLRSGPWEQRIKEECEVVRDDVGVLDLPGFSRYRISGNGSSDWIRDQITGSIPKIGKMNLAYFADVRGRFVTEMSIMRYSKDEFTLITAANAQWHDYELLKSNLPSDNSIRIDDITGDYSTLIVTGPKSRSCLKSFVMADFDLPWLSVQSAKIKTEDIMLVRVSFAGELGWEIHAKNGAVLSIYTLLIANGAKPFGMFALNSLRIEKGYKTWKGDLSSDYSVLEIGLERFVNINKATDFPGKAAIQLEKQRGLNKKSVTLLLEESGCDAPYMATLWKGNQIVGEVTSGAWGYRVGRSIALAMVKCEFSEAQTEVEVDVFGKRICAVVQESQVLWDNKNQRIKA